MFHLTTERPDDAAAIEALLDKAFGPDRHSKISYRYRNAAPPVRGLSRVARADADGRLLGTIRYWPIEAGGADALLLGPIAVEPSLKGRGIGVALMRDTLDAAAWMGHSRIVLVGDIGYYARFGFAPAAPLGLIMPGEKPERLLACALAKDAFAGVSGVLAPRRSVRGGGLIAA
ncbi:MAG: GNAT family N-acetyltransferase [Alphaproteobacteria bacterium]|nr:GNAT family N-acetyltransferase [Alphaproteobacteria bacterium]